jgi:hypothetical protein
VSSDRSVKLWAVNVLTFIFLCILSVTGLINWLLLPRGYSGGEGAWLSLRHFLRDFHQWSALIFLILVVIHMALHWGYIKSNLRRHGVLK